MFEFKFIHEWLFQLLCKSGIYSKNYTSIDDWYINIDVIKLSFQSDITGCNKRKVNKILE